MVETKHRWFRRVELRLVDFLVRRVDQMEGSPISRDICRPRKTIRERYRH